MTRETRIEADMPLVGYCDPLIVKPGETVRCMVSSRVGDYVGDIVRLVHGDPNPAGPGLKIAPVEGTRQGPLPGKVQRLELGSYVLVAHRDSLVPTGSFSLRTWIYPTTPLKGPQGIVTKGGGEPDGFGLSVGAAGDVVFSVGNERVSTGRPLVTHSWSFVAGVYDAASGAAAVYQGTRADASRAKTWTSRARKLACGLRLTGAAPLLIGANSLPEAPSGWPASAHFNGKIDGPRLSSVVLDEPTLRGLADDASYGAEASGDLIAAWDFSMNVGSTELVDVSGRGHSGVLVNAPTRAATGWNWTGDVLDFQASPQEYGAIHFHDDDLEDARWEPGFTFHAPADLPTGVYAVRLGSERAADFAPFFVAAECGRPSAAVAYLAPTLTYLAYANEHCPWTDSRFISGLDIDFAARYTAEDRHMIDNRLLGLYDVHSDGSGVCYSSWRHPIANMRPGYYSPFVGCPWGFNADLHLVDWLETRRHAYDLITDHCVHREGAALLSSYRVVVTGSHPEYWTGAMMDALTTYLAGGGRLMYLGGNGLYWVTTVDPARPHMIEVRRGHAGTRAWEGAPGECHHSTTGEVGGLWRHRGRASQRLVGVGTTAMGSRSARAYRRTEGSFDRRASFIFDGVGDDAAIGDFGLVLGAAAGYEVDRVDDALGTPPHALVLASARTFDDEYQGVVEDTLEVNDRLGGSVNPLVRADMVFFETPNGGAVFSTGSIAWCGALSYKNYENPVSRITENVLTHFRSADPLP
jgi:N,N-dimethylformamidase